VVVLKIPLLSITMVALNSRKKTKKGMSIVKLISIFLLILVLSYPLALFWMSPDTDMISPPTNPQPPRTITEQSKNTIQDLSWSRPENLTTGMPPWLKDYFLWHAQARAQLNQNSWNSHRYLMLQCLPGSRKCGGTADRLKPLPLLLWTAYKSNRILLIKWGRPAELEAFLLPPRGGLDWRVPEWLYNIPEFKPGPRATNVEELMELVMNPDSPLVKARVQSHDYGSVYYNQNARNDAEPTFEQIYHVCWRAMFTPSPPVANLITAQLQQSRLVPGKYVGIHIRALYAVKERDPDMVAHWARNAIHCASQLQAGGPFYMSSDSAAAVRMGTQYGEDRGVWVAARSQAGETEPYHLDKAPLSAKAPDFYDTFVDLYLLAMSRCVTYNMGGYGTWALFISPFANQDGKACSLQHHNASGIHKCEWEPPQKSTQSTPSTTTKSWFLPPMDDA
jgi:hypothetical protein